MKIIRCIGDEKHNDYVTKEQIINCDDEISFDGVYFNVLMNRDVLTNKKGILFVIGNYAGKDNVWDIQRVPYLERFCTIEQVQNLCEKYNFSIGWGSWSNLDLTELSENDIIKEITSPFECNYFAYPHGKYNDKVIECVKKVGYKKAYSNHLGIRDKSDKDFEYKIYRDIIK